MFSAQLRLQTDPHALENMEDLKAFLGCEQNECDHRYERQSHGDEGHAKVPKCPAFNEEYEDRPTSQWRKHRTQRPQPDLCQISTHRNPGELDESPWKEEAEEDQQEPEGVHAHPARAAPAADDGRGRHR